MRSLVLLLLLLLVPLGARAQEDAAALVADSLVVTADDRLVASGNVQAFYQGTVVSAARVAYDRRADRLLIEGPILIRDRDGTVVTAERAEIDPRLEDGLLRGARLVLDRQLQIAANRLDRVGDLTALTGAAATSCQVCPGRARLWEIRAEQVIHDEAARQLYFEDARFLIRGVPILWLPRLRLPDPRNDRATGLLIPRLRSSGNLGFGVQLPYFIVLGPSRDLTLSPFLSAHALMLEARYREAFLNGELELRGAVGRDDLRPGGPRGYLAAEGAFRLPGRLDLAFDASLASDDDYPSDYGLSDGDRIESVLRLARAEAASLFEAELVQTRALDAEDDVPPLQGVASWERRIPTSGGTLTFGASADAVVRTRAGGGAAARDVLRAGAFAGFERDAVLGYGLVVEAESRVALDAWRIADDEGFEDSVLRALPAAAVTLRWPLVRRTGAVADLVEPVASLGWAGALGGTPPDEDSRLPELDEANLHALSRLPGEDAAEEGGRLSLGLSWTREAGGAVSVLSLGRLLRTEPLAVSDASGLAGTASDWLVAGRVDLAGGFALGARALLGDDLSPGRAEATLDWSGEALSLRGAYLRLPPSLLEERESTVEELSLRGELRASERWVIRGDARYDLARGRPGRLGAGVTWRNECVEVDVSVARRYTTSGDGEPDTDFGLAVNLIGFSAGSGPRVEPGACRG